MKKLKTLVTFIICILVVLFAASCGKKEISANDNTFVLGFDAEYPPYGFMGDNGEYTGFDLELAEEVCKRNNWVLKKNPIDWDSKDLEINSGNIDCIWNGFTMNGREDKYTFTCPYVDNSIVFVCLSNSGIQNKKDLAGKIISTQAGSSALTALEGEENANLTKSFKALEQTADYNTSFMNLEAGAVDAIAVDIGVAKYQMNNNKNKFKMLDEELSKEQYAIGFKKGNVELKNAVEKTLFEMYKDGTFMKIANKYSDFNLEDMVCLGNYVK